MTRTATIVTALATLASLAPLTSCRNDGTEKEDTAVAGGDRTSSSNTRNRPSRIEGAGEAQDEGGSTGSTAKEAKAALSEAVTSLQEPELAETLSEILGSWAEEDPEGALSWIRNAGREDEEELRANVIRIWAENSPEAAASWLEKTPDLLQSVNILALLGPWMENFPENAVAWATTKLELHQREAILPDLLVACGSEENALALLGEVDPAVADQALQAAASSLENEEPELAEKLTALITGPVTPPEETPVVEDASPPTETREPQPLQPAEE